MVAYLDLDEKNGSKMTSVRLSEENFTALFERFGGFEDAVITGIRLHVPRGSISGRIATLDIQAMDATADNEWRLVRLAIGGVYEYQFTCSKRMSYFVLSDGLNWNCTSGWCVVDLDPGPDEWSPTQVGEGGEYSKQYVIGEWGEYEVLEGPFI